MFSSFGCPFVPFAGVCVMRHRAISLWPMPPDAQSHIGPQSNKYIYSSDYLLLLILMFIHGMSAIVSELIRHESCHGFYQNHFFD